MKQLYWFFLPYCFDLLHWSYSLGEVIFAINAGGENHMDKDGIRYERDPLHGVIGTPSDHGKRLIIQRVAHQDQILYQTERYHDDDFGYDIPIQTDGDYVMVLKFCEVYFTSAGAKVFDVQLNKEWKIIEDLDIYKKVGNGVAHHEYVTFSIEGGKIHYDGQSLPFNNQKIRVDFIKKEYDNPKINAIYVIKGKLENVPKLPPFYVDEDVDSQEDEKVYPRGGDSHQKRSTPKRTSSGPRTPNPYANDESSSLLPIVVAIGAALPLLFCLCRL